MARRLQAANQAVPVSAKSAEMVKAAEGLWAALLQGSVSTMVEQATSQKTGNAH